jgi:hypothetical protein
MVAACVESLDWARSSAAAEAANMWRWLAILISALLAISNLGPDRHAIDDACSTMYLSLESDVEYAECLFGTVIPPYYCKDDPYDPYKELKLCPVEDGMMPSPEMPTPVSD